jgi:bifunctional DNA-binding transcriptional regulator/antitoxin component of YhaV-PrlF toxin-antitoxin module
MSERVTPYCLPYEPPPAAFAPLTRQNTATTGPMMALTRLSRRYQITIPREMRDGLHPGQHVDVMRKANIIVLAAEREISAYRGILKGVPTAGVREKTDRLF